MTSVRVPLRSITLTSSESSRQTDIGQPLTTWALAELAIARMADLVPEGRASAKTAFVIEWEDGQSYTDSIDVIRSMRHQLEPLAGHVWRSLAYVAGRWRPSHMTPGEHGADLADEPAGRCDEAARVLESYELGRVP